MGCSKSFWPTLIGIFSVLLTMALWITGSGQSWDENFHISKHLEIEVVYIKLFMVEWHSRYRHLLSRLERKRKGDTSQRRRLRTHTFRFTHLFPLHHGIALVKYDPFCFIKCTSHWNMLLRNFTIFKFLIKYLLPGGTKYGDMLWFLSTLHDLRSVH